MDYVNNLSLEYSGTLWLGLLASAFSSALTMTFAWCGETWNCLPVNVMTHIEVDRSVSPLMILPRLCASPVSMVTVAESSRHHRLSTLWC